MTMSTDEKEPPITLTWSITSFHDIVFKEYFPSAVNDLSVQKDVITRFLNFYLGGRVQKGLGVDDVVFAVLAILPQSPYNENVVWVSELYKDDGKAFFLSPEEKLAFDVNTAIKKSHNVQSTPEETTETSQRNRIDNAEDTPNILNDIEDFDDDDANNIDGPSTGAQATSERDMTGSSNEQNGHEPNVDDQGNAVSQDPVDKVEIQQKNNEYINDIPKDIKFTFPKPIQKENNILKYGPVENAAFVACCNKLLSHWHTDSKSRAVLKSFFAVVALVLMRATTKSYKHLFSSFHSEKFLRLLRHSIRCGIETYSPPHKRCLKGAYRTFRRRDGRTPTMFAKFVTLGTNTLNKYLKYVILNGLLNYTADYGFNLIRLLRTICSETVDGDVSQVMESTLCEATAASWRKVAAFLKEHCAGSSSKEYSLSYRWARVLDGRFFKDLSCQQNHELAVILTVFVEKITGDAGVWQSTWVVNDKSEKYRELGAQLYERFESQEKERRSKTNHDTFGGGEVHRSATTDSGKPKVLDIAEYLLQLIRNGLDFF